MFRLFLSVLFAATAVTAVAQDKRKPIVISEPTKLKDDPDYAVQGEYVGETEVEGAKKKIGVQVIARGEGKFELVAYPGGLPGDGWDSQKPDRRAVATTKDGKTLITAAAHENESLGTITNGELTFKTPKTTGSIKKVERKSPTLGAVPPSGAEVLYAKAEDAKANWDNGKIVKLSDGEFLAASNPRSKATFQSYTAHVEFRLAWMPNSRGQGRSNSGVYVQDRYELQVLDSFGLTGENNECGGFYQQSKPKVNMCFPPMVWQTYDIDFTAAEFEGKKKTKNAKVVVKHNGVEVQDYEFTKATPGGKYTTEVPEPGAVFFQDHGDPVVYRNVWAVKK